MRPENMIDIAKASSTKLDPKSTMIFLKGASVHIVLNGDGSYPEPDPEGRSRTGLWMDYVELLRSFKLTLDGDPLERFCQWVYWDPHFTVWSYGERGASAMWFEGDVLNAYFDLRGHLEVEMMPSMRFMWPMADKRMRVIGPSHGREGLRFYGALEAGQSVEVIISSESMSFSGWLGKANGKCSMRISAAWAGKKVEKTRLEPLIVRTGLDGVDRALNLCVNLLVNSHIESSIGSGWMSSLPVLSWIFAADNVWCSMAADRLGLHEWSGEAIGLLASYQIRDGAKKGIMPNEITLNPRVSPEKLETGYASAFTTALWISGLADHLAWSGDYRLLKDHRANLDMATDFLTDESRYLGGLFSCDPSSLLVGWPVSASLEREGACVEVNAWVIKSLEDASSLYYALGEEHKADELHMKASEMALLLSSLFSKHESLIYDHVDREGKKHMILSSMSAVPLSLGILPDDVGIAIVKRLYEQDFMTAWGMRSLSSKDPAYDAKHYYRGAVWPSLTAMYALGCFRYGFQELGWDALNRIFDLLLSGGPRYLSAAYSGDSPEPIGPAWHSASCALAIISFFDGMLGASGGGAEGPTFEPHLPQSVKQVTLQIGDKKIALGR
ncbi:MAG: amylo-alpha-1,6-glucosidase [Thermoprotei archaeon]